ncbi:hypothetical protein ACI1UN_02015 [Lactococcus petauri]|uniref:hypothetical protein n=1 Tax=Lactococcus petauri TaxID=1940789 RepID=UPI003853CEA6
MKFIFYGATYITEDKKFNCRNSELEFENLKEATDFMKKGAICQNDSKVSFIPVVCEQLDEVATAIVPKEIVV